MAYRVRDLLETPHLRLTLKGGGGGLDKPVTWPRRRTRGALVVSRRRRTADEERPDATRIRSGQTALIRGVAKNGMCGMVIGLDAATPELTPAAVALADRLDFPIMVVPYSVGFASIGRAVADAAGSGRVAVTERVYNVIRQSVTNPTRQRAGSAGARSVVPDRRARRVDGAVALEASDPPPEDLRRTITAEIAGRPAPFPVCFT